MSGGDGLIFRSGFSLSLGPDSGNEWSDGSNGGVEVVRISEEGNQQAEDDQKEMWSAEDWKINVVVEFDVNPAHVLTVEEDSKTKRMIVTDTKEGLHLLKGLPVLSVAGEDVRHFDRILLVEKWNAQELPVVLKFGSRPIETNQPQSQSNNLASGSSLLSFEDHIVFLGQTTSIVYDDEIDQKLDEESDDDNKTNPDKQNVQGSTLQIITEEESGDLLPYNMRPISYDGTLGNQSNWSRKCKQRAEILTELLETEKTYINGLEELLEQFIKPFAKPLKKSTQVDVSSFGKKIETLINLHDEIYERFSKAENICIVFQKEFAFIKMYKSCIKDYEESARKLRQAASKKKASFKWIFKKGGGRVSANPLGYFQDRGITLVQRPPRYILLLQQLKKRTPITHPMYNDLESGLIKMKDTCGDINGYLKQLENDHKLLELSQEIDSKTLKEHGIRQLVVPARKLVRVGEVAIRRTKSSRSIIRRAPAEDSLIFETGKVVMCNDVLVIVRGKKSRVIRMFLIAQLETVLNNDPIEPYSKYQKFEKVYEVILRKRQEDEIKRMETFHHQERIRLMKHGKSDSGSMVRLRQRSLESIDEDEFSIYLSTLEEAKGWEKSIRKYSNSE